VPEGKARGGARHPVAQEVPLPRGAARGRLCDRLNGDSFIDLPGRLRHKYGRLIVVLDNAGYHRSGKVAEFVGSCTYVNPRRGSRMLSPFAFRSVPV